MGWKCFIKLKLLVVSVLKICAIIFLMTLFAELLFVTLSLPDPPSLCSGVMFSPISCSLPHFGPPCGTSQDGGSVLKALSTVGAEMVVP